MASFARRNLLPVYVWSVVAGGIAAIVLAYSALDGRPPLGSHPWTFGLFAVLLVLTELTPMPSLADGTELTASWAFAFTLVFVAPLAGALTIVFVLSLAIGLLNRKPLSRELFNAAQFTLSLAVGAVIGGQVSRLDDLAQGGTASAAWLLAVAVACAIGFGLNSVFISVAIALHQGLPIREMIRRSIGINLGMDGLLLALAPIFVVVGLEALVLVPVLLLTVWVIFKSASLALSNAHDATHDQLTGIPNRRMFEDHTALRIEAAAKTSSQAAMIHIDLDGFKGINDRLGHHYGDLVLKEIAQRLDSAKRAGDLAARLGGDEFAIFVGGVTGVDVAEEVGQRVSAAITEPMLVEGVPLTVGASIGISLYPRHGEDVDTMIHHADLAMYEAKAAGGGIRIFADGQRSRVPGRLALLSELTGAIERHELRLVYQPKLALPSGAVVGVEALLRWDHPQHGVVDPAWFMPQAEQTELITPLTDHILEIAVSQCARWAAEGFDVPVAVNVSTRNLHDPRFPDRVRAALERHTLDAAKLEIEITENSVMSDPIRSSSVLGRLRSLGVSISIDDFGTGYSSLVSLRELTLDHIKIDRSFITDLASSDGDLVIVRSLIELGHNLGLGTIAEGVETAEVLALLIELGCRQGQGYLFSRPQPAEKLRELFEVGRVDVDDLLAAAGHRPAVARHAQEPAT